MHSICTARLLPDGLSANESRQACRALKGTMLRQEVYANDASASSSDALISRARLPYTVTERNFSIRLVQPRFGNRHAVFFTNSREMISYNYERTLKPIVDGQVVDEATASASPTVEWRLDPRIQHALTLEVDDFGNVLREAVIKTGAPKCREFVSLLLERRDSPRRS